MLNYVFTAIRNSQRRVLGYVKHVDFITKGVGYVENVKHITKGDASCVDSNQKLIKKGVTVCQRR